MPAATADLSLDELLDLAAGDENNPDIDTRVAVISARAELALLGPAAAALLAGRRTDTALGWREQVALANEAADPVRAITGRADPQPEHDEDDFDGQPVLYPPSHRS